MAKGVNERHIFSGSSRKNRIKLKIKYQNEKNNNFLSLLALSAGLLAQSSVKTERQYLSGRGCDDMVQWDFMCTGGNNSGNGRKSEYLLVGSCKDSVLISMV